MVKSVWILMHFHFLCVCVCVDGTSINQIVNGYVRTFIYFFQQLYSCCLLKVYRQFCDQECLVFLLLLFCFVFKARLSHLLLSKGCTNLGMHMIMKHLWCVLFSEDTEVIKASPCPQTVCSPALSQYSFSTYEFKNIFLKTDILEQVKWKLMLSFKP